MKTTYKVVAVTGYAGHKQGETVELNLTEDQERRALQRGSIKKATVKQHKEDHDG